MRVIAHNRAERNNVSNQDRAATDKCVIPNPAELMHSHSTAEPNLFADIHVSTNMRVVRDDAFIAEHTIMCRMRVRHEQTIGADFGQAAMFGRTGVKRGVLAQDRAIADF